MELTLKTKSFRGYRPLWSGVTSKEFETDFVIPDTMPDVGSVVDAEGTLLLRSRDTGEECVHLEASVSAVVLYQPETETALRCFPVSVPVDIEVKVPGMEAGGEDARTVFRLRVRSLEARMVNSRKVALRVEVDVEVLFCVRNTLQLPYAPEECSSPVYCKTEKITAISISDIREKSFVISDSYSLPDGCKPEKILFQRTEVFGDEGKFVSGKVVFRGRVRSQLLFGDAAGQPLCSAEYETDFSQIMEAEGEGEVTPTVTVALTGVYLDMPDASQSGGKISAEIHMAAQCFCRETGETEYISDIYSNSFHLIPETSEYGLCTGTEQISMRQTVTGKIEPPVGDGQVLAVLATVGAVSRAESGQKTSVGVRVLSRQQDGGYILSRCRLNAEFAVDAAENRELSWISVRPADVYYTGSGGTDVRVTLQLDALLTERKSICYVNSAEADEEDVRDFESCPSVTMVCPVPEEEYWALAKKHHSTVAAIKGANAEKNGGLLLIPKTR